MSKFIIGIAGEDIKCGQAVTYGSNGTIVLFMGQEKKKESMPPWDLPENHPDYQAWLEAEARAYGQEQDRKTQEKKGA